MIDINGEKWDVVWASPHHPALLRSDGTATLGSCDHNKMIIYINAALQGYQLKKVLCHELTHAAMFSYNITLDPYQEEVLADLLSTYGQEIINITNAVFKQIK